jgi:hypothetical protein
MVDRRAAATAGKGTASEHDTIRNVTTVAGIQQYGNYAVALRLAEAAGGTKANDGMIPPR